MDETPSTPQAQDEVPDTSFAPVPPGEVPAGRRQWWGRPVSESTWQLELGRLLVDPVYRGRGVPPGHGEPVLLLPGFLAGDASLLVMARWLRRVGYSPVHSGIHWNVGCSQHLAQRLEARLLATSAHFDSPVSIVGHSRGGHFAKFLAGKHPDHVSVAVALGSALDVPFDVSIPTRYALARTRDSLALSGRLGPDKERCMTSECSCPFAQRFAAPFPKDVPLWSLYSRRDGVVWWESCRVPYARNVEVPGTHVGLATNRHVFRLLGQVLADPFADPDTLPALRRAPAARVGRD